MIFDNQKLLLYYFVTHEKGTAYSLEIAKRIRTLRMNDEYCLFLRINVSFLSVDDISVRCFSDINY